MSVVTEEIHDVSPDDSASTLWKDYVAKIRGGDVGSLPAILGLLVLVVAFSILRPTTFTSAFNFENLIQQSAGVTIIAMGLVFVLLLGEIDLAAGYTAGVAAAVTSVLLTNQGWQTGLAIVAGLLTGTAIGAFHGVIVSRLGIPSFVVTLSTFLALQGVLLTLIGERGSISSGEFIRTLNSDTLPVWLGWVIAGVLVAVYAVVTFVSNRRRRAKRLTSEPDLLWALKTGSLAVVAFLVVLYLSIERSPNPQIRSITGVPIALVIIIGLASCSACCWAAPGGAVTSTPSAAAGRRRAVRASTSSSSSSAAS